MKIYDLSMKNQMQREFSDNISEEGLFILCNTSEVYKLGELFEWDERTIEERINFAEAVRHEFFHGYDIISLVNMKIVDDSIIKLKIDIFVSNLYFVIIIPEQPDERLEELEAILCYYLENSDPNPYRIERLYHIVLSKLAADFFDTLEKLEDDLELLSEIVSKNPSEQHIDLDKKLRKAAFSIKKILRTISNINDEILLNENGLLHKQQIPQFRSISNRFKELYSFAANLYDTSGEILSIYQSYITLEMNATINRLTSTTVFLALISLITGVFNIEFSFLPDIDTIIGYPLAIVIIAAISVLIFRSSNKSNGIHKKQILKKHEKRLRKNFIH
ncbi:MAG: hypothetical protein FWH57_02960 [Oscillospiraceae bacterium]|nr:hypothetical protein [Oscillospiraceae bacterium]